MSPLNVWSLCGVACPLDIEIQRHIYRTCVDGLHAHCASSCGGYNAVRSGVTTSQSYSYLNPGLLEKRFPQSSQAKGSLRMSSRVSANCSIPARLFPVLPGTYGAELYEKGSAFEGADIRGSTGISHGSKACSDATCDKSFDRFDGVLGLSEDPSPESSSAAGVLVASCLSSTADVD